MNELATSNVHLLLVEDNERYLERAIRRLKKFGYQHIDIASNESDARAKFEQKHFDVIIADMRLGRNDDGVLMKSKNAILPPLSLSSPLMIR
jgi:ActR/RegA family two-component response regulator